MTTVVNWSHQRISLKNYNGDYRKKQYCKQIYSKEIGTIKRITVNNTVNTFYNKETPTGIHVQ